MCCRNKADLTEPTVPTKTPKGREGQARKDVGEGSREWKKQGKQQLTDGNSTE